MNYLKYFFAQFLILGIITPIYFTFDSWINPPFTRIDFVAAAVSLLFFYCAWKAMEKLAVYFKEVHVLARVLLTIPAFILATMLTGYLAYLIFVR